MLLLLRLARCCGSRMVGVDAVERRPPSLEGPSSSLVTDVEDEVEELEEVYEAELLESPPRLVEEVSGDGEGLEMYFSIRKCISLLIW